MKNILIQKHLRKWHNLLTIRRRLVLTLFISVVLLLVIYHIEIHSSVEHDFERPRDAIRRAIITSTTIGYGDKVPTTFWGQFLSVFYIICTIVLLSEAIRSVSSAIYSAQLSAMKGLTQTTFTNHTIIYGGLHQQITTMIQQLYNEHTSMEFVVISPVETMPSQIVGLKQDGIPIHFVTGTPLDRDTLDRARIDKATTCILLHEPRNDSDMYLLSYVMSIRSIAPDVKVIVEMMQESNRQMFETAGCNSIINTDTIAKNLLVRSVTDDVHQIMRALLTFGDGYELYRVGIEDKRQGERLGTVMRYYVDESIHIIGVASGDNIVFDTDYKLRHNDRMYIISQQRKEKV